MTICICIYMMHLERVDFLIKYFTNILYMNQNLGIQLF